MIERKRAEIILNAQMEIYEEALKQKRKANLELLQAQIDYEAALAAEKEHSSKATRAALEEAERNLKAHRDIVEQCNTDIENSERALTAFYNGNYSEVEEIYTNQTKLVLKHTANLEENGFKQVEILKKQYDDSVDALEKYEKQYLKGVDGYTEEGLNLLKQYSADCLKESEKAGAAIPEGAVKGVDDTKQVFVSGVGRMFKESIDAANNTVVSTSPSRVFMEIGANMVRGANEGIENNKESFVKKTTNLFSSAVSSVKRALGISSPSKVFEAIGGNIIDGFVRGIKDNSSLAIETVNGLFDEISSLNPNPFYAYGRLNSVVLPPIPRLARGMVIPPNSQFLAVLGDQKQGRNIETPESLLRDIIREEGLAGKEIVIINKLYLDGKEVAEIVNRQNAKLSFVKNGRN